MKAPMHPISVLMTRIRGTRAFARHLPESGPWPRHQKCTERRYCSKRENSKRL
jgi:hypothetical protein